MRGLLFGASFAVGMTVMAAQPDQSLLASVLDQAGKRVQSYLVRTQSIMCLEVVRLQPLSSGFTSEGSGRTVESELYLSWQPGTDGAPSIEAQTLRQLRRVNGHKPRAGDRHNCTTPEQETEEKQPLSLLLANQRLDYQFALTGDTRVDGRAARLLDYRVKKNASVDVQMVAGRDDCVKFDVEGGMRGRIWIDAETYDVLRIDQSLSGMVEIPLPRPLLRRFNTMASWTLERWDTSIRFKPVSFTSPDETLVLPASMTSTQITRGAGTPRLRTTTDYKNYQRFLTAGRVVG